MYNVFDEQDNMEVRNAQIVYMAKELGMEPKEIQNYVGLALSTIKNYIHKFGYMLEQARKWFGDKRQAVTKKIEKVCGVARTVDYGECIPKKGECAYIIEYFDSKHNFLFLKVGKTNNIKRRVREHLNKNYAKVDATYAVVKELHYAKDEENALTLENLYRQYYKTIPNGGFMPKDRFSNIRYSKSELEQNTALMTVVQMFEMAA